MLKDIHKMTDIIKQIKKKLLAKHMLNVSKL